MNDNDAPFLVSIGYLVGSLSDPDDRTADVWQVRIGQELIDLGSITAASIWLMCRGLPRQASGPSGSAPGVTPRGARWPSDLVEFVATRPGVLNEASELGLSGAETQLDELIDGGLIAEVNQDESAVAAFLSGHRMEPLLVGIGDGPDELMGSLAVGVDVESVVAVLDGDHREVWLRGHLHPSLSHAAEAIIDADSTVERHSRAFAALRFLMGNEAAYVDLSYERNSAEPAGVDSD